LVRQRNSRRATVEKLFGSVSGKVEAFYYAFGETDLFIIADVPDNVTGAALSLIVNAAGAAAGRGRSLSIGSSPASRWAATSAA
jgi:uncharacterized protein with GYD domain